MLKYELWLKFAYDDLYVANSILKSDYIVIGSALYHSQQCVEKAFKAFLVYKNIKPKKIHDLIVLCHDCSDFNSEFLELLPIAVELNPFATGIRYPDSYELIYDVSIAEYSVKCASKVYDFVNGLIL